LEKINMKAKIIYSGITTLVLLVVMLLLPQLPYNPILRLFVILIIIVEITKLFKYLCFDIKRSNWVKNTGLGILTVVAILLLLESVFMFIPRSHGVGYTLGSQIWFKKYWFPVNSYGYRDIEPEKNSKNDDVFFIGDSFTAGHGMKKATDRFSNVVRDQLSKGSVKMNVLNLGGNGWDTREEFENMLKFIDSSSTDPEFVVLQYYGNDIDKLSYKNGWLFEGIKMYGDISYYTGKVVQGSYLLNYFYWLYPRQDVNPYINFVANAYASDTLFAKHTEDLQLFIDFSQSKNIPLLVVVFPILQDVELSENLYGIKLKKLMADKGVNYVDVGALVKDIPIKQRVVNSNDSHASILVNKLVRNEIYKRILKQTSNPKIN